MLNIETKKPIKTSEELASIINDAKKSYKNYKKNSATKTFQAIRIFVNQRINGINVRTNLSGYKTSMQMEAY